MSLFAELKRRNVFKVGAAYLALGWVVVQATATLTPAFHLPESALPLVTWVGVIGFPFVIVFAWIYELTPEGLKRESEVDRSQSITQLTSKRLDYTIIAMLGAAMLMFIADRFVPRDEAPAADSRAEARPTPGAEGSGGSGPDAAPDTAVGQASARHQDAAQAASPDDKSIAVLPFVNMSDEASNEFFADGISEELLNLLAKIPELKVIARTSSFAFKGQNAKIAEVARELHVAHILEGSVRKSGNRVRITAQLVRASDSVHLWSETYDRTLEDIFAVQDEIAGNVVAQLKLALLGAAPKSKKANPEAYALALQARQFDNLGTNADYARAVELYQRALELEPGYALALEGTARVLLNGLTTDFRPSEESYRLAREAAERALQSDPEHAPTHAILGAIAMGADNDPAAAARHLERALQLDPGDADILGQAARFLRSLGRFDAAIALGEYRVARDPVNAIGHQSLGNTYLTVQRWDDGINELRTALALSPAAVGAHYGIARALIATGDPAAALATLQQADAADVWRGIGMPLAYHALGREAESDAALAEMIAGNERSWSFNIAGVYAFRGDTERAFEWLDKAVQYQDAGLQDIGSEDLLAGLHDDPRWLPLLRKLGRAPEQLAAIPFEVKLPK